MPESNLEETNEAAAITEELEKAKGLLAERNPPQKILLYPSKKLKSIAKEVDFSKVDKEKRMEIVRKLATALSAVKWGARLGIAATQIGIDMRVMVVRGNVMFNPEWIPPTSPTQKKLYVEGCYSLPQKTFNVWRDSYGWAKWVTIDGEHKYVKINGIAAVVFQHEIAHLNGKCCADEGKEIINESTIKP